MTVLYLEKISLKERLASADRFLYHTIRLGNGRLKEMIYANGNIMRATYNGYGQLIAEKWYSAATDAEPEAITGMSTIIQEIL